MGIFQYINKLFCTLFVFCGCTKTYSQREIHPLEPMFTYDYALKYYSNLPIAEYLASYSYWFLENFSAPIGVESIEEYSSTYSYYHTPLKNFRHISSFGISEDNPGTLKNIYYYNKITGNMEKSIVLKIDQKHMLTDTIIKSFYSYKIDSLKTIIDIERSNRYQETREYYTVQLQYIFDTKTKKLIRLDNKGKSRTYSLVYEKTKPQTVLISDNDQTVELKVEDVVNQNVLSSNDIVVNDSRIFLNRISNVPGIHENRQLIHSPTIHSEDIVQFSKNHITYNWQHTGFPKRRSGLLLFNDDKELTEVYFSNEGYNPDIHRSIVAIVGKKETRINGRYNVIKKRNNDKWISSFYKNYRRKNKSGYTNYVTDSSFKKSKYKIKDNIIYWNDSPFIIYNYN